jgi:hypothetical protein
MTELGILRTRLRVVNMEYSALRKRRRCTGVLARMAALRAERQVLMALIAALTQAAPTAPRSSRARVAAGDNRCASSTALSPS